MTEQHTRKDYMDKRCTHREYYAQFVTDGTRQAVARSIGLDTLFGSRDANLNDIPLKRWDNLMGILTSSVNQGLHAVGDYPTLAGKVCIAKEAALQVIEAGHE